MTRSLDPFDKHDTGIKCTGPTFKDFLVNKGAMVVNFVTGEYEIIGSVTSFLQFMMLFKD